MLTNLGLTAHLVLLLTLTPVAYLLSFLTPSPALHLAPYSTLIIAAYLLRFPVLNTPIVPALTAHLVLFQTLTLDAHLALLLAPLH